MRQARLSEIAPGWMDQVTLSPGRYLVRADGVPVKQESRTNTGKVLQGYFFRYATPFFQGDRWKVIPKGAFDASLKKDRVRALLEHNDALEFGDTKSNLILESNDTGIAYRIHLRNDEISRHVRALVEARQYFDTSIGFSYRASDAVERTISKTALLFINKATLIEGSILKAGACEKTSVTLKDMKDCDPLFVECAKSSFSCDSAFADVMRQLRNLDNA
jgi:HK97 family phage prohead protease